MTPSSDPDFDAILARFMRDFEAADDKAAVVERYCAEFPQYAAYWRAHAARHQQMHVAAPGVAPPMPRLKAGDRLGEFTIVDYLAGGGMGEIYLAKQRHVNERLVAIKIIRGGHVSPRHRQRFERELAVLAKLHQTNIVPVYGAGEQDDIQYIAMQYIDGASVARIVSSLWERHSRTGGATQSDSLAKVVESVVVPAEPNAPTRSLHPGDEPAPAPHTPPSLTDVYLRSVAAALAEVAEALHVAHAANVLHRDVKPSNLMIEKKSGKCWLIDFGLAGLVEGGPPEPATPTAPTLTAAGDVLGTFAYMAPEQFDGHADERSDVWGLGVTLYELLTLRRAFNEKTEAEYKHAIQQTRPLAPGTLVRKLPRDLEAICAKAMHRTAAERYATAGEFAADLRRWLRREPTVANPPWVWRRVGMWSRRNPGWAAALAAMGAVVMLFVGLVFTLQQKQANEARLEADHERERAEESARNRREVDMRSFFLEATASRVAGWRDRLWAMGAKLAEGGKELELRDRMASLLGGLDAKRDESFQEGSATFLAFNANGERLLMGGYRSRNPADPKDKAEPTRVRDLANGTVRTSEQWAVGPVAWRGDVPVQLIPPRPFRPTYRLWNVDRNALLEEFALPPGYTPKLAPNIEGQNLAGVVLSADASRIAALAVDPQGQRVIVLWNAGERQPWQTIPQPGPRLMDDPEALTLSPEGSLLALGTHDGKVHVWTLTGAKPTKVMEVVLGRVAITGLTFGRHRHYREPTERKTDGTEGWLLGIGTATGTVAVWDVGQRDRLMLARDTPEELFALAFSTDGVTLYTTGRSECRCWDTFGGKELLRVSGVSNWVPAVATRPQTGDALVGGVPQFGSTGKTHRYTLESNRGIATYRGLQGPAIRSVFTPDGSRVALLTQDLQVGVWEVASGELLFRTDAPPVTYVDHADIQLSPDGRFLVVIGNEQIERWKLPTPADPATARIDRSPLNPAYSNKLGLVEEGRVVFARTETLSGKSLPHAGVNPTVDPRCVRIYEWTKGEKPKVIADNHDHNWRVHEILAAPDGSAFYSDGIRDKQGEGHQLNAYDGRTGATLWTLSRPADRISHCCEIDDTATVLMYWHNDEVFVRRLPFRGETDASVHRTETLGFARQYAFKLLNTASLHLCVPGAAEPFLVLGDGISVGQSKRFTPEGRFLAWGDTSGALHVCDLELVKRQLVSAGFADW